LHGQHIRVQRLKALPQPAQLGVIVAVVVGLLAVVEMPLRQRQIQHVAGRHHQRGVVRGFVVVHGATLTTTGGWPVPGYNDLRGGPGT
jgi:hypothetical protein